MDCFIKTELNQPNITNALVHSLRSLGQLYGRISLRSRAAPINLPSMRGVMVKSNEMSRKSLVCVIFGICFFSFLIQLYYIGSLADSVANVSGNLIANFMLPIALALVPSFIFLFATSKTLNRTQKMQVYIFPMLFVIILISYFYWIFQYGTH
jgi:heme/copper-type cytochrome/quinol oxidase subunit 4